MRIGIPKETRFEEKRVALAPAGVDTLIRGGHTVYVQTNAGETCNFTDEDYRKTGANIVYSPEEVYLRSEMIVKVAPIADEEVNLLQEDQILFSFLHLALSKKNVIESLLKKNITAIGYELIEQDDFLPVQEAMSEIAGQLSIQVAEQYLENRSEGGRGILLGGIPGVAPAAVVIIGGGVVGTAAARAALGRGAQVIVIDKDLKRLKKLDHVFGKRITTVVANPYTITRGVKFADVLIGAILIKGSKVPHIVTEDMVMKMKKGSVIVDVSIDQGGCIETSRVTSISDPVYKLHNVIHFGVPNLPALVSRTSSFGLNNATINYIMKIAEEGLSNALISDQGLSKGVCTYKGYCSNEILAGIFNIEYRRLHIFSTN
jgi:alanine dehydrogenase